MDDYKQIEKAKALTNLEESDPRYGTQLFIALRSVNTSFKESMRILRSLNLSVSFEDYFAASILGEVGDDPRIEEYSEAGEKIMRQIKKENPLPSSELANMIWIEGIKFYKGSNGRGASDKEMLMSNIEKIKRDLFNNRGG